MSNLSERRFFGEQRQILVRSAHDEISEWSDVCRRRQSLTAQTSDLCNRLSDRASAKARKADARCLSRHALSDDRATDGEDKRRDELTRDHRRVA